MTEELQSKPMITMVADEDAGEHAPRVVNTPVLKLMAEEVKDCNVEKGWYDTNPRVQQFFDKFEATYGVPMDEQLMLMMEEHFGPREFGDDIALLHSEVSEVLEAFRDYGVADVTSEDTGKPEGVGSELADVLVRLLDTCHRYNIDLFAEWRRKVDFNWTRTPRHGGKRL